MEPEERPLKMRKLEDGSGASASKEMSDGDRNSAPKESVDADVMPFADLATNGQDGGLETKSTEVPLSKNQQKKLLREQAWEAGREDRKIKRKEKIKAAKEQKRQRKVTEAQNAAELAPKQVFQRPLQLPVTFIFDCSYDDLMLDKEIKSLTGQLTRSYSDNCRARFRAHLVVSSFKGKLKERFDTTLMKHYEGWKGVRFFEEDFVYGAQKSSEWLRSRSGGALAGTFSEYVGNEQSEKLKDEGETIYLSSDSDFTLTHLKPYCTYIIGGLVDRNRHKGICHRKAMENGIKTAKLPIGEYLEMSSRSVLATNHVAEIMLKWLTCGDWGQAFMEVIPKRKGGTLRDGAQNADGHDGEHIPEDRSGIQKGFVEQDNSSTDIADSNEPREDHEATSLASGVKEDNQGEALAIDLKVVSHGSSSEKGAEQ